MKDLNLQNHRIHVWPSRGFSFKLNINPTCTGETLRISDYSLKIKTAQLLHYFVTQVLTMSSNSSADVIHMKFLAKTPIYLK